jgi:O-antigen/teichoic acid export membrane protein
VLAFFGMIRSIYNPVGSLLLARGRADLGFFWNVYSSIISSAIILLGSLWGLIGISFAQIAALIVLSIPFYLMLIKKMIHVGYWEYHKTIVIPLLIALSASIIPFTFEYLITNYILKIIIVCISGLTIYYFLTLKFNRTFLSTIKSFR